jgi:hypothetical protein
MNTMVSFPEPCSSTSSVQFELFAKMWQLDHGYGSEVPFFKSLILNHINKNERLANTCNLQNCCTFKHSSTNYLFAVFLSLPLLLLKNRLLENNSSWPDWASWPASQVDSPYLPEMHNNFPVTPFKRRKYRINLHLPTINGCFRWPLNRNATERITNSDLFARLG